MRWNTRSFQYPCPDPEIRRMLVAARADDIEATSRIIDRDLTRWLALWCPIRKSLDRGRPTCR